MRILVIEDEEKLLHLLSGALQVEGYVCDEARDGKAGLELALKKNYDLVILDIMLPLVSGTHVLRTIRAKKKDIPILMLTAQDAVNSKVEHLEAGADDYLTKPFSFEELLARIKVLLRRTNAHQTTLIKIRDLEINRITHQVWRNKKPVALSMKEYALLEYLARNPGRVLSRAMIIQEVWDASFDGMPTIVDIYISQLRAKIDEGHSLKFIHTERGVGYSFAGKAQ